MCSLSILAKVCVRVFIKVLNMASICFSQQKVDVGNLAMLSFQSPYEENEVWVISKATCFKEKAT